MKSPYCGEEMIRMCTIIFWMMTEGKMQSFLKKHFKKNPVQYMNMSRIFLFTTIFFTIFPSIIRKIFHCNDYSYPPSP